MCKDFYTKSGILVHVKEQGEYPFVDPGYNRLQYLEWLMRSVSEDDRVIIMDALTKHTDCPQLERDHALRLYALYLTAVRGAIGEAIPDDE